ncbi:MAG TPA: NAD(P)H-dependent oxidoreductase [Stellaceae bacterium]|jgi:chromate reductase
MIDTVRLLGLPGSLRRGSYSSAVLDGLAAILPPTTEMEIRPLRLPLYDQDEDGERSPAAIRTFRDAIAGSDGLVIVTPEYNHGVPGVLKNALDWASRPYGASVLQGKPALVISVSPAFTGGVRAQAQLNETLLAISSVIVPGPQIVIGNVAEKIADGRLTDEASLAFARIGLERLVAAVRTTRPKTPCAMWA